MSPSVVEIVARVGGIGVDALRWRPGEALTTRSVAPSTGGHSVAASSVMPGGGAGSAALSGASVGTVVVEPVRVVRRRHCR